MSFWRTLAAASLLLGLAAAGCRRVGPPLAEPDFRRRVAEAAAERGRLTSFSAEYSLVVEGTRPSGQSGKLSCSGVLVAEGGRLRMRGEKVLGMTKIFDLVLDGPDVRVHLIHGNKFLQGRLGRALEPRGAAAFLDGKGGLDFARLLLPAPDLEGPGAPELAFGQREVEATWRSPDGARIVRRMTFAADTGEAQTLQLLDASGRAALTVDYQPPGESRGLHPVRGFRVRVEQPARLRLSVRFADAEANGAVKPGAFTLEPPAGAEVVDLDKPPATGKIP
jgi:hypothetical protein